MFKNRCTRQYIDGGSIQIVKLFKKYRDTSVKGKEWVLGWFVTRLKTGDQN